MTDRTKPEFIGADVGSNNTAELSAIYYAMIKAKGLSNTTDVTIYTDSQYAMNIVFGNWSANKNLGLVKKCRQLKDELDMAGITITAKHIRARTEDSGGTNERISWPTRLPTESRHLLCERN